MLSTLFHSTSTTAITLVFASPSLNRPRTVYCTRGELTSIARMGMPVQRRGRIHSGQQPTRQDSPTGLPHDFAARTDRVAAAPPPPAAWCVQMESCHGEGWHSETGCPVPSEAPGRPKTRFGGSSWASTQGRVGRDQESKHPSEPAALQPRAALIGQRRRGDDRPDRSGQNCG